MMVDFGEPLAALFGASAALITIAFTAIKWRTWQEASRARATKIGKAAVILAAIYMCYASLFNSTPDGTGCQSSASLDGLYIAERCLLKWVPGGSSKYVGRLFDAKSRKLLAQRTFTTSSPEIEWSINGRSAYFSRGDSDDGDDEITLPPSRWDRLLAARPRL
ncbi:hypothetical protein BX604_1583 [Burkholderia sp. JKS000303]|nr:hypothetical protein BX604_1583 [Burkholderia sp. JKS000303]